MRYAVTVIARPLGWSLLSPRAWWGGRSIAIGLQVILKLRLDALTEHEEVQRRIPVVTRKGKEINH